MLTNKQEPTRLELYKAGKLEERRSERTHQAPLKEIKVIEEEQKSVKLSPEAIAISLMVILLLILTATAL